MSFWSFSPRLRKCRDRAASRAEVLTSALPGLMSASRILRIMCPLGGSIPTKEAFRWPVTKDTVSHPQNVVLGWLGPDAIGSLEK